MKFIFLLAACVAFSALWAEADSRMVRAYDLKGPVKLAHTQTVRPDGKLDYEEYVSFDSLGRIEFYREDINMYDRANLESYRPKRIINHGVSDFEIKYERLYWHHSSSIYDMTADTLKLTHKFHFENGVPVSADLDGWLHNYAYDSRGNLIHDSYKYHGEYEDDMTADYRPLEFDSHGNWVKREVKVTNVDEGKTEKAVQIRKIEYWPEKNNREAAVDNKQTGKSFSPQALIEHPFGFMSSSFLTQAQVIAELKKVGWPYREDEKFVFVKSTAGFKIPVAMLGRGITKMSHYYDSRNKLCIFYYDVIDYKSKWTKQEAVNYAKQITVMLKDAGYELKSVNEIEYDNSTYFLKEYKLQKDKTRVAVRVSEWENAKAYDSHAVRIDVIPDYPF